jgi:hypothetical protein
MNKRNCLIPAGIVFLLTVFVVGCGTIQPAIPEQTQNSAIIYIIQPTSTVSITGFGSLTIGSKFQLWDNDTWLGLLGSNSYIVYYATPGVHYFMARGENWDIVKADLKAGKTYYLKTSDTPGFTAVRVILEPVDPKNPELQKWLDNATQITPKDKASEGMVESAVKALENVKSGSAGSKDMPADWGK